MSWYSWFVGEVPKTVERTNTVEIEEEVAQVQKEALDKIRSSRKSLDETLQEIALLREEAQDIMAEDDSEEPEDE